MSEPSPREPDAAPHPPDPRPDQDLYLDESEYPPDLRLPDQESTLDLVMALRLHDPAAEEEFVNRFVPILRGRAHHRLSQRARRVCETEDLVQSALYDFLRFVGRLRMEHSGAVEACLLTMLRRELAKAERQAWDRPEVTEPDGLDQIPDSSSLGQSPYAQRIAEAMKRAALRALDERERRAVELKLEGRKPSEIARALGMAEGDTSQTFIRRAFQKFQDAWSRL